MLSHTYSVSILSPFSTLYSKMKLQFRLEITAQLENIKRLSPKGGVNSSNMPYFFKLHCENCNETTGEQCTYMSENVYYDNKEYNHVVKCKVCERVGTVKLIPGSGRTFTAADSGAYVPLMVFECDGLIAHKYIFNGGWLVVPDFGEPIEVSLLSGSFVGSAEAYGDSPPKVKNVRGRFVSA